MLVAQVARIGVISLEVLAADFIELNLVDPDWIVFLVEVSLFAMAARSG